MRPTIHLTLAAAAAVAALAAAAQTREPAPAPPQRSIITAEAPRTPEPPTKAADTEFLVEALRTSLAEVKMGELAAQRARDQRVRDYGTTLARDHKAHATEIERVLEPRNVTVPGEPSAEALSHYAALERLSPDEFDAAFVQMMVWTHTDAIEKYGAQTHANPDKSLSDFASKGLTMLREHLRIAESLGR